MPLRKPLTLTPAKLAANRANALKSTGPRSPRGKARVALNALQHGRCALRLRENLALAGDQEGEALYGRVHEEICRTFEPKGRASQEQVEEWVRLVCSLGLRARRGGTFGAKPKSIVLSAGYNTLHPLPLRIRFDDPWRRIGLVFWVRRRRYWTLRRLLEAVEKTVRGQQPEYPPPSGVRLEQRLRWRRFRLAWPGLWERLALEKKWNRWMARKGQQAAAKGPRQQGGGE